MANKFAILSPRPVIAAAMVDFYDGCVFALWQWPLRM